MSKPRISAFTIVRNAVTYDYPIVESIRSILPLVDEYVVAVGRSDDDTLGLIKSIGSPKIRIVETVWDDSLRKGGAVLAIETNKALDAVSPDADWCFYLQGDEVIHEQDHQKILDACEKYADDKNVDGLLFDYMHFYGSYNYIGDSRKWYRTEVRIVRNNKAIRSFRDAQGFKINGGLLKVKRTGAHVYHYGWVKDPKFQQAKQKSFHKMWHDDEWMKTNVAEADEYDYKNVDSLKRFEGSHPAVMNERVSRMNWDFHFDVSKKKLRFKDKMLYLVERLTGKRLFEYKNYRLI